MPLKIQKKSKYKLFYLDLDKDTIFIKFCMQISEKIWDYLNK